MSLKDQGNQYFRQGLYPEAINCYQQYIDFDPQADKKVAYTNISFCQYKLGQYRQSIESADDAISEDSTYKKAYYRRIMGYKQLPECEYEVFVNIHLLLKYSDTMGEKEKYDYREQMKEWKEKWFNRMKTNGNNQKIESEISLQSYDEDSQVNINTRSIDQWLEEWNNPQKNIEQHWKQIEQIAKSDAQYAVNLSYLLLNQLKPSQSQYFDLKDKIKNLQESVNKMDIQEGSSNKEGIEVPVKENKKSSSSDDNLFDMSDHSSEPPKQNLKPTRHSEQKTFSEKDNQKQEQHSMQREIPKKQEVKHQIENNSTLPVFQQMEHENQDFNSLYKKYVSGLSSSSRDQIADLLALVQKILSSSHSRQIKQQLLEAIKKDYVKLVLLMKKSFTKGEQNKVYQLLEQNNLKEFVPDFASKHAQ